MKKTSIAIDDQTRRSLDEYCKAESMQLSEAIRVLIQRGLKSYEQEKATNFREAFGASGLMVNEKKSIQATFESLLILRKLGKELLKTGPADVEEAKEEALNKLLEGWYYDNK